MSELIPLRTCIKCGKKAYNIDDLKNFRKEKRAKYGCLNICNECRRKIARPEVAKWKEERKKLEEKGFKKCSKCKIIKSLNQFFKKGKGYSEHCKQCDYEIHKEWRKINPDLSKYYNYKSYINNRDKIRYEALKKLCGGEVKCIKCGFNDFRALAIDHINGEGASERKKGLRSNALCYYILKLTDEEARKRYQVLCANCNWIKRVEEKTEGGKRIAFW